MSEGLSFAEDRLQSLLAARDKCTPEFYFDQVISKYAPEIVARQIATALMSAEASQLLTLAEASQALTSAEASPAEAFQSGPQAEPAARFRSPRFLGPLQREAVRADSQSPA